MPAAVDTRGLGDLVEVSQMLTSALDIRSALGRVLEHLEQSLGALSATVALREGEGDDLTVEAAVGVGWQKARRARYRIGEGITGRVVESCKPVVVPQVSREPLFLNRSARPDLDKKEISYVCVPIVLNRKAAGALAVDLPFKPARDYDDTLRLLKVVASMLGQALKVERLADTERLRLIEENTHLKEELRERYDFSHIIGNSGAMRRVYEQIAQ